MILLYSIFYIRVDLLFQVRYEFTISNHFYLKFVRCIPVLLIRSDERCFKYFRNILEFRMIDDIAQCIKTDMSEADIFMAVFVCSPFILGVVDVQHFDPVDSDCLIEFFNDTVEVGGGVGGGGGGVGWGEGGGERGVGGGGVDDVCKLFKSPSHFRSFARHRFQGNLYSLFG